MRKKLYLLLVLVVLSTFVVGGMTFALFTAQASNDVKPFKAGSVSIDLDRGNGESIPGPMFYTTAALGMVQTGPYAGIEGMDPTGTWTPGDSHARSSIVKNDGTLQAKLTGVRADYTGSDALKNALVVTVSKQSGGVVLYQGPLSGLCTASFVNLATPPLINPGGKLDINFTVALPLTAGNDCQGQDLKVDFYLLAEQNKNNP